MTENVSVFEAVRDKSAAVSTSSDMRAAAIESTRVLLASQLGAIGRSYAEISSAVAQGQNSIELAETYAALYALLGRGEETIAAAGRLLRQLRLAQR